MYITTITTTMKNSETNAIEATNLEELYDEWGIDEENISEPEAQDGPQNSTIFRRQIGETLATHTGDKDTLLTRNQEQELAKIIENGHKAEADLASGRRMHTKTRQQLQDAIEASRQAQHTLVECNMKFAAYYARASMGILKGAESDPFERERIATSTYMDVTSLKSPEASLEDRTQLAMLGLVKAAAKFKPHATRKTVKRRKQAPRFATYAAWSIVQELDRGIRSNEYNGLRLPDYKADELRKLHQLKRWIRDEGQQSLTVDELAIELDTTPEHILKLESLEAATSAEYSFDMETGIASFEELDDGFDEDRQDAPLLTLDEIVTTSELGHETAGYLTGVLARKAILEVLGTLSEREAGILYRRFGLDGEEWTLDQIGKVYGVTRGRINQLESKAMSKLDYPSRKNVLKVALQLGKLIGRDVVQKTPRTERPSGYFGTGSVHLANESLRHSGFTHNEANSLVNTNSSSRESWQSYADEPWELPSRGAEQPRFKDFMLAHLQPLDFARISQRDHTSERHAHRLIELLKHESTGAFALDELEQTLPSILAAILRVTKEANPEREIDGRKIGLFLSQVIGDTLIANDDAITVIVPDELKGKIEMFGKGIVRGTVRVNGDLGDFAGYKASEYAHLIVDGNVGDSCGYMASGDTLITVNGSAGYDLGRRATDRVAFEVDGTVESLSLLRQFNGSVDCNHLRRHGMDKIVHSARVHEHKRIA